MQLKSSYHYVNKVIACVLSVVLIMMVFAVPAHAEEKYPTTPSGVSLWVLEDTIDSYVAMHQENTAAVSIVAINKGETVFSKAYGFADIEQQIKADTSTVFEWGSVSKLLVWTSVMQLVEQGKLDLETNIEEYLPKGFLKKLKYDTPITLMNLMNHNAGWEDRIIDVFYVSENEIMDLGEALQKFEPRQVYKPESVVAYSNFGAALAAYIVEVQSGQLYYEYVNEHIFKPLNMNDTSIHPLQQDHPDVKLRRNEIQGYTTSLKLVSNNRVYISIYPAGGAIGTVEDAGKFMAALMPVDGSNLLFTSKDTLNEMLSPSLFYDGTDDPRFAHGFFEAEYLVPALEHGGNMAAFTSKFVFDPESNFGLVVMTNQLNEWNYCSGLVHRIFGDNYSYTSVTPEKGGYYLPARRVYSGFSKLYYFSNIFESNELSWFTNVIESEGKVVKASDPSKDYFLISSLKVNLIKGSFIVLAMAILFSCIALIGYLIRLLIYKLKRWEMPGIGFNKYHVGINIAGVAFTLNTLILFIRAFRYSSYSSLRIHLIFNIIYVILAVAYLALLFYKLRKISCSKKRKALYIMSSISALIFAATIVGWDLYF